MNNKRKIITETIINKEELIVANKIYEHLVNTITTLKKDDKGMKVDVTTNEPYYYFIKKYVIKNQIINVKCYVYLLEQYNEFINLWNKSKLNNEADYDKKEIIIRTAYDFGGKRFYDKNILNNLIHEIHHIWQYSSGLKKDETLYEIVVKNFNNIEDEVAKNTARVLYYTFYHEQDAFMADLYTKLTNFITKSDGNYTIEDIAEQCPEYEYFETQVSIFDDMQEQYNTEKLSKKIKDMFGLSLSSVNNKINMTFKRFENRFKKCILKIEREKNNKNGNLSKVLEQASKYNYPLGDSLILE